MPISIFDQLQVLVELFEPAKRIVSLVPSQTELLFSLGLQHEVVGITKFCVHPHEWYQTKTRVGGTKTVDIAAVQKCKPDLVLANKEENVKEQIDGLRHIAPVWVSDIETLEQSLEMIRSVGTLTGKPAEADEIASNIAERFTLMPSLKKPCRTAYAIWKEPLMVAGGNTFINDIMRRCGMKNIFSDKERYPQTTVEELKDKGCQLLLLSSEPYPFKEKHVGQMQEQLTDAQIELVDGEMFSWYGSRLLLTPDYLAHWMKKTGQ